MTVTIPYELRPRHTYVPGSSGHGKSTVLENMIVQDIHNGAGVCVLDPGGDLVERVLTHVPEHRKSDCWYLDIADPIPVDFTSWNSEREKQNLLGDLFQIFLSFSTMTAGDQWLSILRKTIQTIIEAKGCSFLDIGRILEYPEYRKKVVQRARNADITHYWDEIFPQLKQPREDPILTRMSPFTMSSSLQILLGSPTGLNLRTVMQNRQILLVNLGSLTKEFGNLVGKLLVSRIQQIAFSRAPYERIPFFLYADEFQDFQTSAFDTILSQARKFKLSLTLANQGLYQLEPNIRSSIFANVTGAWIILRVDTHDARFYKPKTEPYDDLVTSLPVGRAIVKVGNDAPMAKWLPEPLEEPDVHYAEYIRKRTKDMHPCNSAPMPHYEGNARSNDKEKPSRIQGRPGPPPNRKG